MDENLEDMSFEELCSKIDGFEETYEKVCATSYSFMNKVEKWLVEKAKHYGDDIGFIIVPDLVAISFLFFENFVEMPSYLTEDKEIKEEIRQKLKKIRKIKQEVIDDFSSLMLRSEKGNNFFNKQQDDEAYQEAFVEIKNEFHHCVLDFYEQTREAQKNQTSLFMMGGLLSSIAEAMAFSDPDLRDGAKEIIVKIKNSWTEIYALD